MRYLVTGGTGSFGRAFIRTILADEPTAQIISISRNAEMRYRLEADVASPRLTVMPGDVRHRSDLAPAFARGVDVVIHAAAEKHIGTGQKYADYVRSVNLDGAANLIAMAGHHGARVVALSTDKACNPVNLYGETKAEAERLFLAAGHTVVRYGNVVGSSGSVIPLFIQQRASGRVTVTDRRMTRFWMPLADGVLCDWPVFEDPGRKPVMSAVRWVRQALAPEFAETILVPQIPSARVEDVARAVAPGCEIVETGIRDGEKLHEELIGAGEFGHPIRGGYVVTRAGFWLARTHYTSADDPLGVRLGVA